VKIEIWQKSPYLELVTGSTDVHEVVSPAGQDVAFKE